MIGLCVMTFGTENTDRAAKTMTDLPAAAADRLKAVDALIKARDYDKARHHLLGLITETHEKFARTEQGYRILSRASLKLAQLAYLAIPTEKLPPPRARDLTVRFNRRVDGALRYFLTHGRNTIMIWLERSGRYVPLIQDIFSQYGIPRELAYVAMIESGFNSNVRSSADAIGMWQFMENTMKYYDMRIYWWADERKDFIKSTHGAAKYLKKLYDEFGDWHLALAGYNMGPYGLANAIKYQKTKNYWDLHLPRETENYVPRILAMILVAREPESFGLYVKKERPVKPIEIQINGAVDIQVIAQCAGISPKAIEELNPHLVAKCTPSETATTIYIPEETRKHFTENFAKLPESEKYLTAAELKKRKLRATFTYYQVKKGDSWYRIARKHRVSVNKLRVWNPKYARRKFIHPGNKLRIYRY